MSDYSITTTRTPTGPTRPASRPTPDRRRSRGGGGVPGPRREIAFGANMTTITFHLCARTGTRLGEGDEVVVTALDHHANVAPWQALARERGVTLRTVDVDLATGDARLGLARSGVHPAHPTPRDRRGVQRTRYRERRGGRGAAGPGRRSAHARGRGALRTARAGEYAGSSAAISWSARPTSSTARTLGSLYGRQGLIETLDVPKLRPAPETAPERLETGTHNHEGIAGAAAAVDFLASIAPGGPLAAGLAELHRRGGDLVARLWNALGAIDGVTLYGPPPGRPRTPTVAFTVRGMRADDVARALAERARLRLERRLLRNDDRGTAGPGRLGAWCGRGARATPRPTEVDRLVEGVRAVALD